MSAVKARPIPPLYCVYVLRSTVNHSVLYIGSTPHPPRRLKQHNGEAKGGAVRTARAKLRPWEMVAVLSGFPSSVAALKFEWAMQNPHLSMHIPSPARISISTQRKRNGQPKRPRSSMTSIMGNLHILVGVPSFARWPLRLHFFARDVYAFWERTCAKAGNPLREGFPVFRDFGPEGTLEGQKTGENEKEGEDEVTAPTWGIHALPVDYTPMKDYVAKGRDVFGFEREGTCVVCREELESGKGIYALCSNDGCEGVGHLDCWSRHMRSPGERDDVLPMEGRCPKCSGEVKWVDMMRELTLRMRGPKDVEKLLKKKRLPKAKVTAKAKVKVTETGTDTEAGAQIIE